MKFGLKSVALVTASRHEDARATANKLIDALAVRFRDAACYQAFKGAGHKGNQKSRRGRKSAYAEYDIGD